MGDGLPAGPRLPGLVQGALLVGDPGFVRRCHRRYGDRFSLRLGRFGTVVYIADPALIREVFHGEDTVLHAGEANAPILGPVLGPHSVLVTDEEEHLRNRRRLSGPFHGEAIARLAPVMADVAAEEVESWPVGRPFPVQPRMQGLTLEVILRTVIGARDPARLAALRGALSDLVRLDLVMMAQFAFPALRSRWPWRRLGERQAAADRLLHEEIEAARGDPGLDGRDDVLAALARHREPDGSALTAPEMRDHLATLLLAGHETTATGLAWAFERLVRHPEVLSAATAAARSGDDGYLDAVVAETLRARPVVPDVSRRVCRDTAVGDLRLPAGTFVNPAIGLVHRSPRLYPDAERFDPSRFVGRRPDPSVWIPFGGGNRRCIGAAFAATEMRVVLAEVLRRVDLAPTSDRAERARTRHVTLAPARGGRITVAHRAVVAASGSPAGRDHQHA